MTSTTSILTRMNPIERAWVQSIGCKPKPRKSGTVRARIATDTEARAYGIDLHTVRSNRSKAAAAARKASPERVAVAETVEHIAETGEAVAW